MGGTFDPAHLGHIKISKEAKKKFKLEKVYWAVTNKNPFKSKSKKSLNDRINYAKKILNSNSKIKYINAPEFHKIVQVKDFSMDTRRIRELGFKPKIPIKTIPNVNICDLNRL